MKNAIPRPSSKSATGINLYQFLHKYFFLLFVMTYLSIVTITTISWDNFCSQNNYCGQSVSSNSLDRDPLAFDRYEFSNWLYTFILFSCSLTPWLLAYIFRHKAFLMTTKKLRRYSSTPQIQRVKHQQVPVKALSTPKPKITIPHQSTLSYRISSFKCSPKIRNTICKNTKNIRLPFESLK